jgi:glucose-1-phosphate cytidylyltransferase
MEKITKLKIVKSITVVILCGGRELYIKNSNTNENEKINKSLIPINNKLLIYWNVHYYIKFGYKNFILVFDFINDEILSIIKKAFNGKQQKSFIIFSYKKNIIKLNIVSTNKKTSTSEKILSIKKFLKNKIFAINYSDTLSNVDLNLLLRFHIKYKFIGTLIAAKMPVRFKILGYKKGENVIRGFSKNPVLHENEINGGFYYFNKKFLTKKYLNAKSHSLEERPLDILSKDLRLGFYEHEGLWQHLDNVSDIEKIIKIINVIFAK